jgi:DNA-binding Lrp family transcriptional regulator
MIAEEVNVSAGTIRNRINQLEEAGIIQGHHAHIDYERVENRLTNLFVCIAPVGEREKLANQALDVGGVNVREPTAGRRNVHVVGLSNDTDDLTRIATQLSGLGLAIEEETLVQQESVQPYSPFGGNGNQQTPSLNDFISLTGDDIVTPKGETRVQSGDIITLFSRGPSSSDTIAAFGDN